MSVGRSVHGQDLMPTEARESISSVKPTGWKNKSYDTVDGGYVYNRCHLIGFQLTGENANEENLITGTRYMNVEGMLPFEDEVAAYIKETDNHVMYRVTPVFEGDDLVASGVQMQAESVEDDGVGISFNVYVYNVQPYVVIDYKTGENWEGDEIAEPEGKWADGTEAEPQIQRSRCIFSIRIQRNFINRNVPVQRRSRLKIKVNIRVQDRH